MSAAFAFACSAGVIAAFNPCGAAMLPGWIGFFVLTDNQQRADLLSRLLLAIGTSLAVTAGLIAVFGTVGLAVNFGLSAIHAVLPSAILILGAALTTLGVIVWRRGEMPGVHIGGIAARRQHTIRAIVGFGAAYGIAALSCALPVFLISVGGVGSRRSSTACGARPGSPRGWQTCLR